MAKTNYNGTATAGASKVLATEHNGRRTFFFHAKGGDMTLNFGATATADNILSIAQGASIFLTKGDPYPIEKEITVFCASAVKYEAQADE